MTSPRLGHRSFVIARRTSVPIAVVVLAAACSGSDGATLVTTGANSTAVTDAPATAPSTLAPTTTTAPAPSSAAPTPSTTTPPTSSTTAPAATSAPESDPGDDAPDWFAIVDEIRDLQLTLPQDPSLAGVDDLCVADSTCAEQWSATIGFLVDNDARLEGGVRWQLDAVEFQGTTGDVPLDEATAVTLIVRETVTESGPSRIVGVDGSVLEELSSDERFSPGQLVSRTMVLGRSVAAGTWRLVAESEPA